MWRWSENDEDNGMGCGGSFQRLMEVTGSGGSDTVIVGP